MADTKISALSSGAPAQAGDEYVIARSGSNFKLTLTNIAASMPPIGATTPNTGAFTSLTNGLGAVGTPSYTFTGDLNTGMWSPTADTVAWSTGGSERMRIDSSGNVGIGGTADANAKVQVKGTLPTSSNLSIGFIASGTSPSGSTSAAYGFYSNYSTAAASFTLTDQLHFYANPVAKGAGSTIGNQYGFFASSGLTEATNNFGFYSNIASGSNRFNFYANGTAFNYFAGDTAIGRANSTSVRLFVQGANTSTDYTLVCYNSAETTLFYARNNGEISTGTAASSPYNNTTANAANVEVDAGGILRRSTSSLRYKSNVADATHGLADVLKLRSVTYKGKNDGDKVFGGLIAEEVHDAGLTEFVAYDKEGQPDALHYGNMVALLVKAVQELKAELEALKAK